MKDLFSIFVEEMIKRLPTGRQAEAQRRQVNAIKLVNYRYPLLRYFVTLNFNHGGTEITEEHIVFWLVDYASD